MTCYEKRFTPYQRQVIARVSQLLEGKTFQYEKKRNNHLAIKVEGISDVFHTSATPSDFRAADNFLGDIRSALNRRAADRAASEAAEYPSPSQAGRRAKKSVQVFVQAQNKKLHKQLKRNLRSTRKEEFKMLIQQLQDDDYELPSETLAISVRQFRETLVSAEIDRFIHQEKGDLFIPSGMLKGIKKDAISYLNNNLASLADHRARLNRVTQRWLDDSASVQGDTEIATAVPEECVKSCENTKGEPKVSSQPVPLTMSGPSLTTGKTVGTGSEQCTGTDTSHKPQEYSVTRLVSEKPYKRIAAIKVLEKEQIRQLMEDCEKALNQKHEEDIHYLLAEMQKRGVGLNELQQKL